MPPRRTLSLTHTHSICGACGCIYSHLWLDYLIRVRASLLGEDGGPVSSRWCGARSHTLSSLPRVLVPAGGSSQGSCRWGQMVFVNKEF